MAKNINEFRLKLLSKIRQADSEQSISRFIDTAVRTLVRKKVHGHLIVRFLERSATDLESDDQEAALPLKQDRLLAGLKLLKLAKVNMSENVQ